MNPCGVIVSANVTQPGGSQLLLSFDPNTNRVTSSSGVCTSGCSQSDETLSSYERDPVTNLMTTETVTPLANPAQILRKTGYTYDSKGNVLTVTELLDRPAGEQIVLSYSYEPSFNQVTSVTLDPSGLNLRTDFAYDAHVNNHVKLTQ